MKRPRLVLTGALVGAFAVIASACTPAPPPPPGPPPPPSVDGADDDDLTVDRVSGKAPSFGGHFVDEANGVLKIYLQNPGEAVAAVVGLRELYGDLPARVEVLQARYTFAQLKAWFERVHSDVLTAAGVVFLDLNEGSNRLQVGVESQAATPEVEARLARSGVPREAVNIEVTQPVRFETSLQNRHRPLVGGLQIATPTSFTTQGLCTLGFNVIRAGAGGFVTNSHCTRIQGGVENSVFHQPNAFVSGNRIGIETVDPAYFTGGACPAGRRCRYSDTAFVDDDSSVSSSHGFIARSALNTTAWNGIDRFRIVAEQVQPQGVTVCKTGRTTGRTCGTVNTTSTSINVADTNITLLAQDRAGYSSAGGDSGSPVYRIVNSPAANDVRLVGIHWGSGGFFSDIDSFNIQRSSEMGPLDPCPAADDIC
jgi:hypothetical protein